MRKLAVKKPGKKILIFHYLTRYNQGFRLKRRILFITFRVVKGPMSLREKLKIPENSHQSTGEIK